MNMKKRFWKFCGFLILLLLPSLVAAQVPGHYSTLSVDGNGSVGGDLGIAGNVTIGGVSRNTWPSANPSPLTAKGDIFTRDGSTDTRLPIGTFNQVLVPDSTTSTGLRWSDGLIQIASDVFILATNAQEAHGVDKLNMTQGFTGDMQDSAQGNLVDATASSGFTYDGTNKLYRNTQGGTGLNSDVNYSTESNFVQQEWTDANQGTSQATFTNASATVTISSGTWPTNAAGGRVSPDGGTTWYNIQTRDSGTQVTLVSNYTGTTGAYSYKLRMSALSGGTIQLSSSGVSGNDTNTKLLLHADGTNGSTTFTDSSASAHGVTASGGAQISTTQSKFGGASASFNGTASTYVSTPGSTDFSFTNTDSLTIDFWFKLNDTATAMAFMGGATWANDTTVDSWVIDTYQGLRFAHYSSQIAYSWTKDTNWHHFALVGVNGSFTMYLDGTSVATGTMSASWGSPSSTLYLGTGGTHYTNNVFLNAYMDEVRFTKGVARWTANFTPPSAPYSGGSPTSEYVSTAQGQSTIADSSAWSQINSFTRTETLNSQSAYYWFAFDPAVSYGAGTTIKVWNATGAVWRPIAQNSSGTWQYNNDVGNTASTTWVNSTVNDILFAVSQAISAQAGNRMTGSQLAAMTSGQIQGTGGWTTSVQKGMVGVTLYSTSSLQNPTVTQVRTNYNAQNSAMDLRTKAFSVSSAPTSIYLFTIDKQLSGTPTYYITCDGGTTWVSETMSAIVTLTDGRTVRRWTGPTTCTGTDMRARVTVPVGGNYEISAIGEQSR